MRAPGEFALRVLAIILVLGSVAGSYISLYRLHPALMWLTVSLTVLALALGWIRSRWGVPDPVESETEGEIEDPPAERIEDDGHMEVRFVPPVPGQRERE